MITCEKCGSVYGVGVLPLRCRCGYVTGGVSTQAVIPAKPSQWLRWIACLRHSDDIGVGDTVQRIAAKFGGERFKFFAAKIGIPCGCSDRQDEWNRLYPYY